MFNPILDSKYHNLCLLNLVVLGWAIIWINNKCFYNNKLYHPKDLVEVLVIKIGGRNIWVVLTLELN